MIQTHARMGLVWALPLALALATTALAQDRPFVGLPGQNTLESKLSTVYYDNEKQLLRFKKKIKPKSMTRALNRIYMGKDSSPEKGLARFLDILFKRVQMILEMPMPELKVNIVIHPDPKSLGVFFKTKYGGPTAQQTSMGAKLEGPAFFVRRSNTIHLQTQKMRLGILAHEMAHSVTENYFVIRPPTRVAEIMSQHVDREVSKGRF